MRKLSISMASVVLLAIQLLLVSTVAAKYLWQRWRCPRVWTRTAAIGGELAVRGRYLGVWPVVDACESTLPSARNALFIHNPDGSLVVPQYTVNGVQVPNFTARLQVRNGRLLAIYQRDDPELRHGEIVVASAGTRCDALWLQRPVNFYLSDTAKSSLPLKPGQELWIELTVPPSGPPRPLQLAVKEDGAWKPM